MLISIERQGLLMFWFKKKNDEIKKADSWNSHYFEKDEKGEEWKNLSQDKLEYAMEEARLIISKLSDNTSRLTSKGFTLLAIIGGLIGFIFTNYIVYWSYFINNLWLTFPLTIYFGCLICAFYILRICIRPIYRTPIGTSPNFLLKNEVMKYDFLKIIITQLENYQGRIDKNTKQNDWMSSRIELSLNLATVYPTISIILYSVFFILAYLFV
jgi:hypothetical protein